MAFALGLFMLLMVPGSSIARLRTTGSMPAYRQRRCTPRHISSITGFVSSSRPWQAVSSSSAGVRDCFRAAATAPAGDLLMESELWPLLRRHRHIQHNHEQPSTQQQHPSLLDVRGGAMVTLDPVVVKASMTAVGELLIACSIGAFFTRRGILDRNAIASLSSIVYHILLPSLLVVNVAKTVYATPLLTLLPLPLFGTMQIILCSCIAWVVTWLLGVDVNSAKGRQLRVLQTFGNGGVAPILFATVLLRNHPDPSVLPLAISYISFYLLGWTPIFWTYGYNLLVDSPPLSPESVDERAAITSLADKAKYLFKNPPPVLKRVASPPIIGSVGGLLLGISPLAKLFLGPAAPLGMLTNAIQTIGSAYTSMGLLVLAGSLALPLPALSAAEKVAEAGEVVRVSKGKAIPIWRQIASVCLVRFCLCPALCLSIILRSMSTGFIKLDRLMVFVLFLQSCMPSAQNSVLMVQLSGRTADATKLARMLLFIYSLSCIPISILLTLFLQKFSL